MRRNILEHHDRVVVQCLFVINKFSFAYHLRIRVTTHPCKDFNHLFNLFLVSTYVGTKCKKKCNLILFSFYGWPTKLYQGGLSTLMQNIDFLLVTVAFFGFVSSWRAQPKRATFATGTVVHNLIYDYDTEEVTKRGKTSSI